VANVRFSLIAVLSGLGLLSTHNGHLSWVRFRPIAGVYTCCDDALMSANRKFQCCYCDSEIEPTDTAALRITVTGLWSSADGAVQDLFAHERCAADKLAGNLSQWVPFDVETFRAD
jgi:hypothetical protein